MQSISSQEQELSSQKQGKQGRQRQQEQMPEDGVIYLLLKYMRTGHTHRKHKHFGMPVLRPLITLAWTIARPEACDWTRVPITV